MKTAQIIQHPGAAVTPVVQKSGPGRRPKMVVKMRALQLRREDEIRRNEVIATEIESVKSSIAFLRKTQAQFEEKLRLLTDPGMTKEVRNEWVREIEYDRLPWQEKERVDALRAGRGQVIQMPAQ